MVMDSEAKQLLAEVKAAAGQLKINELNAKLSSLKSDSEKADFWQDNLTAAATMQEIAKLQQRTEPWNELLDNVSEIVELVEMADPKLEADLNKALAKASAKFSELKQQLMLSGGYDDHGAVLTISAGAGGTDAQDWTQMLFRMYARYFDKNGWKYSVIDQSPGEEAGLKSIVIEVDGNDFIYGKLRSEHGVHRLVRLSPFNADNLRQTSFAKVEVLPKISSPLRTPSISLVSYLLRKSLTCLYGCIT